MPNPDPTQDPNPALRPNALLEQVQWVRALARSLVRDANDADDLSQEALLAAVDSPPQGNVRAWFSRVLRNKRATEARSSSRRARREQASATAESLPSTGEVLERAELLRKLVETAFQLREPFRTTLLLRYFEGLDPDQIARQQGIAAATVRSRLKRGLDDLRERLDHDFGNRAAWCLALLPLTLLPVRGAANLAAAVSSTAATTSVATTRLLAGGTIVSIKTLAAIATAAVVVAGAAWLFQPDESKPARPLDSSTEFASHPGQPDSSTIESRTTVPGEVRGESPQLDDESNVSSGVDLGTGSIRVQVASEQRLPVDGVVVHATLSKRREADLEGFVGLGVATRFPDLESSDQRGETDVNGFCEIHGLAPGSYQAIARGQGFRQQVLSKIVVEAGQSTEVSFLLAEGLTIEGVVLDPDGRPVADAEVTAQTGFVVSSSDDGGSFALLVGSDPSSSAANRTTTDAQGYFVLEGLAPQNHELRATHPNWTAGTLSRVAAGSRGVTLTVGRGATLSGVVLTPEGTAIAGAVVQVPARPDLRYGVGRPTFTDDQGHFQLDSVPLGSLSLRVTAAGYAPLRVRDIRVTADVSQPRVEIVLTPGASAFGQVVDVSGVPIEKATISLEAVEEPGESFSTPSLADGTFRFANLVTGERYDATVRHAGYLEAKVPRFDAGVEVDLGVIQLLRGASIAGRVVDASSAPVTHARVFARRTAESSHESVVLSAPEIDFEFDGGGASSVSVGPDGEFRIEGLEAGDYTITVHAEGFTTYQGDSLSVGESVELKGLDVQLDRGLSITGRVVDPAGRAVPGATVTASVPGFFGARTQATSDVEGAFRISGLTEPVYGLTAKSPALGTTSIADVPTGSDVELRFRARASLIGTVSSATTGLPIEEFDVSVDPVRSSPAELDFDVMALLRETTPQRFKDPSGAFRLAGLEPGAHSLVIRAKSFAPSEQEIVLREGEELSLELLLERGGAVTGRVVNADGEPIVGATVRLREEKKTSRVVTAISISFGSTDGSSGTSHHIATNRDESVRTDPTGHFVLDGLEPGSSRFVIDHGQYLALTTEAVDVVRDHTHDLRTLTLARGATIRGTVSDAQGNPVHQANVFFRKVNARGERAEPVVGSVSADGTFRQSGLAEGRYLVEVMSWSNSSSITIDDDSPRGIEIDVRDGEVIDRDFRIP